MEKNTLFAFLLIAVVLILTPYYLEMFAPPQAPETTSERTFEPETPTVAPAKKFTGARKEPAPLPPTSITDGVEEQIVTVITDLYTAVISNSNGGSIRSFKLPNYTMQGDLPVQLIDSKNNNNLLISAFSIDGDSLIFDGNWMSDNAESEIRLASSSKTIHYYTTLNGRALKKSLTFYPGSYEVGIRIDMKEFADDLSRGVFGVSWPGGLPSTEINKKDEKTYFATWIQCQGDETGNVKAEKYIDKSIKAKKNGKLLYPGWVAARSKFFIAALMPAGRAVDVNLQRNGKKNSFHNFSLLTKALSDEGLSLYLGPLDHQYIKPLGNGLDDLIFGWAWIQPISRGVLALLVAMHKFIPNYGVVLILFSLLVKIVTYPLTKKSYQSSQKMQALQPQIMALKEKHKKNPQQLNKATMALYKEGGANPLGGCLPMLIQMPLLIALFQVFRSTIELRGAPFILWINDLSAPDTLLEIGGFPLNILPLVMALTMFVQQKMMATAGPNQQKTMMYMMNVFFVFIFYRFPSGLNLYYTLFNLLTILQQKFLTPPSPVTVPATKKTKK